MHAYKLLLYDTEKSQLHGIFLCRDFLYNIMENELLTYLFSNIHIGKPKFIVKIIGKDNNNKVEETMIQGSEEATITALTACHVSQSLYDRKVPFGVYHIEQLFSWEGIYPILESRIEWKDNY